MSVFTTVFSCVCVCVASLMHMHEFTCVWGMRFCYVVLFHDERVDRKFDLCPSGHLVRIHYVVFSSLSLKPVNCTMSANNMRHCLQRKHWKKNLFDTWTLFETMLYCALTSLFCLINMMYIYTEAFQDLKKKKIKWLIISDWHLIYPLSSFSLWLTISCSLSLIFLNWVIF